jgi:hypothetical protein
MDPLFELEQVLYRGLSYRFRVDVNISLTAISQNVLTGSDELDFGIHFIVCDAINGKDGGSKIVRLRYFNETIAERERSFYHDD